MSGGIQVYSEGPLAMSVCADAVLSSAEVEETVNSIAPTGITARWHIADEPTFKEGEPMPCPCNSNPERRHWLLHC